MKFGKLSLTIGLLALPLFGQDRLQNIHIVTKEAGSYLGVNVLEVDAEIAKAAGLKEERGVQVTLIDKNSPASRSGLKVHDIVLEFNGQRVEGTGQFVRMIGETPIGRKVTLGVFRSGAMQTLTAQIGARPMQELSMVSPWVQPMPVPTPPMPPSVELSMPDIPSGLLGWQSSSLGYMSEPVDGQLAEFFGVKEGVLVRSVMAKSPAERAGLKAGDVIVEVDGSAVKSPREITGMLRHQRERKPLSLKVVRSHKELTLELIAMNAAAPDSPVL